MLYPGMKKDGKNGTRERGHEKELESGVIRARSQGNTDKERLLLLSCGGAVSIDFSVTESLSFREGERFFEQSPPFLVEPVEVGMNALSTSLRKRIREHGLFANRFIY